ncbi:uncharacterized protein [Gossypium hirsutum]|uniref:Retrovirus-related Pol polyprotein from transposon TNT 1-94 n=1 Tax=Gossypium hirsutum TaxID=3635 RepID=A0ABM3AMD0_GOSHI|nr:uncharacterized protein LOC121220376 [Gossypium hirsutum]
MPNVFWAEAVNTAIYLLNRLPTNAVKGKTPFEAWFAQKPSVSHLKVFGCLCYVLVPEERRTKLDRRSMPGVFVGYSNVKKGYRVFDPLTKKVVVSRDVKFSEASSWKWDGIEANLPDGEEIDVDLQQAENEEVTENGYDDQPVRGTRTLTDIYERCAVTILEPSCVKWVYRIKNNANGSLNRHKARLVVKGYSQQQGVDFSETFAPVARLDTIRLLLALAAQKHLKVHHLDVKSAFLNGFLNEEIFIEQPEGFKVTGEEQKVYKLKKALYGLKQAPRAWYERIDGYLARLGFIKSISEPTLYVKKDQEETLLIVSLYVDDLLVIGCKDQLIEDFKKQMQHVFEMTDLGLMTYFLGMEIKQGSDGIFISQQTFASKVFEKFCMLKCKPVTTPVALGEKLSSASEHDRVDEKAYRSLIGCLLYLTATRPDIVYAVSLLSRFMHCSNVAHLKAAKRVLRYVKGTIDTGVKFWRAKELKLVGYSDSDWAGWSSKKQQTVAQSTAEAEYISAAAAVNQAIWLRKILDDLNESQVQPTEIRVDNQSAVAIAKNPVFHDQGGVLKPWPASQQRTNSNKLVKRPTAANCTILAAILFCSKEMDSTGSGGGSVTSCTQLRFQYQQSQVPVVVSSLDQSRFGAPNVPAEPVTIEEAFASKEWTLAAQQECDALLKNNTWNLVLLPANRRAVGCKWVLKLKRHSDGTIARYKGRLVVKGYLQETCIDFQETFSLVVKRTTIRVVLTLAVKFGWQLRQVDINNAFLNDDLSKEIYMVQPSGFEKKAWLSELGSPRKIERVLLYVLVYVDDIIITGNHQGSIDGFVSTLDTQFSLKDLGLLSYFFGIEVTSTTDGLFLSQCKYVLDLLRKARMDQTNGSPTPMVTSSNLSQHVGYAIENESEYRSIVGVLQYVVITKPDITFAVNKVFQFIHRPLDQYFKAIKRILRYLQSTMDYGLHFTAATNLDLVGYSDANWGMIGERLDLFFVREKIAAGKLNVGHIPAQEQVVDVFTKPLSAPLFAKFRSCLKVVAKFENSADIKKMRAC